MTSLQHQLRRLKKAETRALTVERDYSSLIYTKKDAASFDREEFYKIGLAGLSGMKILDDDFDQYEPQLFQKDKLHMNRAMLGKEEAESINEQIVTMIMRLSPYFHHQCCRQVLEWLIHKYQVHAYNAETLFLAFLPYHNSNTFGRLIHILKFNSPDMDWLTEYQKDASPIPLNILCRATQSARSFWLISALTSFIQNIVGSLDAEYINSKMPHYFTFIVSLFGTLVENEAGKMDEKLLLRLIPFIGIALRSKLPCFKCAGIMLACTLAINVGLSEETAHNFLELLFYKLSPEMCKLAIQTANVICERLDVKELPEKTLRLIRNNEKLQLTSIIGNNLMAKYDMTAFLVPFWKIILDNVRTELTAERRGNYIKMLIDTQNLEHLNERQAQQAFNLFLDWMISIDKEKEMEENNEEEKERIIFSKKLRKHIRAMVIRFPEAFDAIQTKGKPKIIKRLMKQCQIEQHEVIEMDTTNKSMEKQRKRKRQPEENGEANGHNGELARFSKIKLNGGNHA